MCIFVFGSNLRGVHGKGAALTARKKYGAVYGQGEGLQGRSYAIPTKDYDLRPLPLEDVNLRVLDFLHFARHHPGMKFNVTRIGCGLAGYVEDQIAPMFKGATHNVRLPRGWKTLTEQSSGSSS